MIAQKNGQVYYVAAVKQSKPETGISMDRSGLPSGVIHLTLLDDQMEPVAERLIFNLSQRDTLPVAVSTDKKTYRPRENVTVTLHAGTTRDSIRIGSFSAAVTDLGKCRLTATTKMGS